MKSWKIITFVSLAYFILSWYCNDGNPYLAGDDSGARIVSKSFEDGDTVSIFSTESLSIVLHLKEHIDHISLRTQANRFWSGMDTVIPAAYFDREPFTFRFSFYDTGWQEVSVVTHLTTGDSLEEKLKVYTQSPLHQADINARLGDTVFLSTPPVSDNALYIWDFRDGTVIRNNADQSSYIVKTPLTTGMGEIYVSDNSRRSPSAYFMIVDEGARELRIFSLNDSINGDTVYAGDADFTFRTGVTGAASILTATINGRAFEKAEMDGNGTFIFTKVITGLDARESPVGVKVEIADGTGAFLERTFLIQYTVAVPRFDRPILHVLFPSKDSITTNTPSFTIHGYVGNRTGFDSLTVFLQAGDSLHPDCRFVGNDSLWQWTFNLEPGWNPISLMVFEDTSRQGDTLTLVRRAIEYAPGEHDTIKPELVSLLGNGTPLANGRVTADPDLLVKAGIFDNSGSFSVEINEMTVAAETGGVWFSVQVTLTHRTGGTPVSIIVLDAGGNRLDTTVTVNLNRPTVFTRIPPTTQIPADSLFSTSIGVSDPDGDSVSLTAIIRRASGDSALILGAGGLLTWRPLPADTGWHTVEVRAWDGFEPAETTFIVYVSPEFVKSLPVRFLTTTADLPDSLVATEDTLRLELSIDPVSGTLPVQYSAYVVGGPVLLEKSTDAVVLWAPTAGDTGVRRLELIVRDDLGFTDTVTALVTVVTARQVTVNFDKTGSSGAESVSPRTIRVRLSEPARNTITAAYAVDQTKTTADSADFDLPIAGTLIFSPGDTVRDIEIIIVNDSLVEYDKNVTLSLTTVSSGAVIGTRSAYSCKIIDDDKTSIFFVDSVSSASEAVSSRTIMAKLSLPAYKTVTIGYLIDSTSSTGSADYRLNANRTLTFAPGQLSGSITVTVVDDSLIEGDETLLLKLANPSSIAVIGNQSIHACRIIDNDTPAGVRVEFTSSTSSASESAPAVVSVRLSAPSTVMTNVDCMVDTLLSTVVPADYQLPADRTLTFQPGDTVKTITIAIVNDTIVEPDEKLVFKLTSPSAYVSLGGQSVHTHTVVNDDFTLQVTVSPAGAGTVKQKVNGAASNGPYRAGTAVELTAMPAAGYRIVSWSGPVTATADIAVVKVRMDSSASVGASFNLTQPVITVQPINQNVIEGQGTFFSIAATGLNLTYQWQRNGTSITGATGTTFATPVLTLSDNGVRYRCIVGNTGGSITSHEAKVAVSAAAPVISVQPHDTIIDEGKTAVFSIAATASGLSYRWQRNGKDLSGATLSNYTTPVVTITDSGSVFRCIVTNAAGSVTSSGAMLSVRLSAPSITTQPSNQSVAEGGTASFSLTASGSRLSYQWQKNGIVITGATASLYTTPATVFTDSGSVFRCIVLNGTGSVTSNPVTLNVALVPPVVVANPSDKTVNETQPATFTAEIRGSGVTYQWQKNGAPIIGATAINYTIPSTAAADSGSIFLLVAGNRAGTVTTAGAMLRVRRIPPSITTQPADKQVVEGQTATFSITASGSDLGYQWSGNAGQISGANNASYTTPAVTMADSNTQFRCTVSNPAGWVTSTTAVLTVRRAVPVVTIDPSSITVIEGQPASFSIAASGTGLSYQWLRGGIDIAGATDAVYLISATAAGDNGARLRCSAWNGSGSDTSAEALLTVLPSPVLPTITGPVSASVVANSSVTFTVTATGGTLPVTYQWRKNTVNLPGATDAVLSIASVQPAQNGELYQCVITNPAGTVTSAAALLTVQ